MKLVFFFITSIICNCVFSQTITDKADDYRNCESQISKLRDGFWQLSQEKNRVLGQLRSGHFCSECGRTAIEIENTGVSFQQHLKDVRGKAIPAPPELINQKSEEYDNKIDAKKKEIESKEIECYGKKQSLQIDIQNELNDTWSTTQEFSDNIDFLISNIDKTSPSSYHDRGENIIDNTKIVDNIEKREKDIIGITNTDRFSSDKLFGYVANTYENTVCKWEGKIGASLFLASIGINSDGEFSHGFKGVSTSGESTCVGYSVGGGKIIYGKVGIGICKNDITGNYYVKTTEGVGLGVGVENAASVNATINRVCKTPLNKETFNSIINDSNSISNKTSNNENKNSY